MYYIAYGSNLNKSQMAYRCPDAKPVGKTTMKGWKLVFNGVATIEPDDDHSVPIGIWKISKKDEKALDRYEGYPHLYRKEYLTLAFTDKKGKTRYEDALVYIMNAGRRDRNLPSSNYYNTIKQGYADFKMDSKPLQKALEETYTFLSKYYYEA